MDLTTEEGIRKFTELLKDFNLKQNRMCPVCSKGKYYRSGEPYPFILYDIASIKPVRDEYLVAIGKCSDCGHEQEVVFHLFSK